MDFTDKYGGTAQLVNGEIRPYASQEDADNLTASGVNTDPDAPSPTDADQRTVAQIKTALDGAGVDYKGVTKRAELVQLAADKQV